MRIRHQHSGTIEGAVNFLLGEQEDITWRSNDGTMAGGVLVKPVGYEPGPRYPLIVLIQGGPAWAEVLGFNGVDGFFTSAAKERHSAGGTF
jgi:dipeptidyl aminopeptidase/acylaminoacyl peptidase